MLATVNVPETAPLPFGPGVTMLHPEVPPAKSPLGVEVNEHVVAFEPKPFPATETTAPKTPFAGVTATPGTTTKSGPFVGVTTKSVPGFPVTCTCQGDPSAVASELTTKVPVAVPPLIEQVGEVTSDAPFGPFGFDVTVHDVSVLNRPRATKDTVVPGEANVGVIVSEGPNIMLMVPTAVAPILSVTITW